MDWTKIQKCNNPAIVWKYYKFHTTNRILSAAAVTEATKDQFKHYINFRRLQVYALKIRKFPENNDKKVKSPSVSTISGICVLIEKVNDLLAYLLNQLITADVVEERQSRSVRHQSPEMIPGRKGAGASDAEQ